MHNIRIEPSLLPAILDGEKTIEICLGTPEFLKMRVGDTIALLGISESIRATITQLLYFETLEEAVNTVNYTAVTPTAEDPSEVIAAYRQRYSEADEEEYGAVAITFSLVE